MPVSIDSSFMAFGVAAALILMLATLGSRFSGLKRAYYSGILLWSQWLPVLGIGAYLAVLAANIATGGSTSTSLLSLNGAMPLMEIVLLFVAGPIFLTPMGHLVAGGVVIYLIQRALFLDIPQGFPHGLYILMGSSTVVAILGDKMPWNAPRRATFSHQLRETLIVGLAIGSLGIIFASMMKLRLFSTWLNESLGLALSSPIVFLALVGLFAGWLTVAMGFTRHFTLPLLTLPTLFALAYISGSVSSIFIVPFATCLALSLAVAERRQTSRRTVALYGGTQYLPR